MVKRIRLFATPPIFEDEEKNRLAWLLQVILLFFAVGLLVLIVSLILFIPGRLNALPNSLILLGLVVADLQFMRRGYVRPAASLFGIGLWLIITLISLSAGGVMSTAFGAFLILIVMMGLLVGKWGGFVFAGLSALSGALMLLLDSNGMLPSPTAPALPSVRFLVFTLYFLFAGALLALASTSIQQALRRARRGESDLAERNRELQNEINERKRVDEALQSSETQLRLALEAAQIRSWHWDAETGHIRTSGNAIPDQPDFPHPESLDFEAYLGLVHPEDVESLRKAVQQASAEGSSFVTQYRLVQADGTYRWFETLGKGQVAEASKTASIIGMTHDITLRKDAERQQLELQLQKERLAFLTEFMGNMSHDIRTPLTVIKTSIYLMERLNDPEKIHQRLQIVSSQIDLVEHYIDDILTISRLDAHLELALESTDLNQLIQEVEGRLHLTAENKKLHVNLELGQPAPILLADVKQMDHVLMNLIENAYNYTPEGGEVMIRTETADSSVMLEVRDTGIGISEADMPLVFNRFYRGENARVSRKGGTGLGLAIVKKIVERHDGDIELESIVSQGTTFRVRLPIKSPQFNLAQQ